MERGKWRISRESTQSRQIKERFFSRLTTGKRMVYDTKMEKLAVIIADMVISVLKYEKEHGIQCDSANISTTKPLTKPGIKYKVNQRRKVNKADKNER
jgi:tRNA(Ile2) C34 agmatinyltransferase TiaS